MALALLWILVSAVLPGRAQAPAISEQPIDHTTFYGDGVTFTVTATGSAPLSYQWFRNGAPLAAATTPACALPAVSSNDAGAGFSVVVTNPAGAVTSRVAVLTVDFGTLGPARTNHLLSMTAPWNYNVTGTDLGTAWAGSGYDDSSWPVGPALLYTASATRTSNITGGPLQTWLGLTPGALPTTCYFRTHFTNPAPAFAAVQLSLTTVVDDGVVVYLNGGEAFRLGISAAPIFYSSYADRTVGDASLEGPFNSDPANLVAGDNVLAAEVHQVNATSSDIVWGLSLDEIVADRVRDTIPPVLAQAFPEAGATVPNLSEIEVQFSEGVKGVAAGDLLINGAPATNMTQYAPNAYVFDFPQPANGLVQVVWSPAQAITDLSANSNRFAGGGFSYTLDSSLIPRSVRINEFMASNAHTIRDDDGQHSDWIELYNSGDQVVQLGGWYLTDNPGNLAKWRIPDGVSLLSKSYLLVWASGLDLYEPGGPTAHQLQAR